MQRQEHLARNVFVSADVVAALLSALAGYILRFETGWITIQGRVDVLPSRYLLALPATIGLLIAAGFMTRAYDERELRRPVSLRVALRSALLGGSLLAALALGYRDEFQYSRLAVAFTAVAFVPFSLLSRHLALGWLRSSIARGRAGGRSLLVGRGAPLRAFAAACRSEPWLPTRVDLYAGPDAPPPPFADARCLDVGDDLLAAISAGAIDDVIIAEPAERAAETAELIRQLNAVTAAVRIVPDLGGAILVNPHASVMAGVPVISLRERPLYGLRAASKRALDVVLSAVLLVAFAPLLALIGLLIRSTSPGPVLYSQERVGIDGKSFVMHKLRTMCSNAEEASGPVFASPADTRVTPLGRLLRRFSIDELPQLWNVLRGDMSLVGPRPERGEFIEEFRARYPGYMLRHAVRTGMTGWAQVNGLRGGSSLEDRLRYDLEYIDRWSLLFDAEILLRTVAHVAVGRNAY